MNRPLAELRAVGATPDEIRVRAGRYLRVFDRAALTPTALAKHWASLASERPRRGKPDQATELMRRAIEKGFRPEGDKP